MPDKGKDHHSFFDEDAFERVLRPLRLQPEYSKEGEISFEFVVTPEMCNPIGSLHGGFIATAIDTVTSMALLGTSHAPSVSVDMHITYLKPAPVGTKLRCIGRVVKQGKKLAFLEGQIVDARDATQVVAKGAQTKCFLDLLKAAAKL